MTISCNSCVCVCMREYVRILTHTHTFAYVSVYFINVKRGVRCFI